MDESPETMSEAEAMHELAKQMWERYFKQRAVDELLNHSLDGYKATVDTNNGDGTLTVVRPFDNNSMTLKCPPALARKARSGDQVLVVSLGEMSNSFVLCGTDMSGFGSGDAGERVRLLDFSDIEELETFLIETENDVTETYTVTRDAHGRIVTIEDEDGFDTYVQWPEFTLTPADKIGYDNTDSGSSATNVQEAIDELFAGGGGGGPELSDDNPVMDGATPSPGTSAKASRADHRHETDSSRASAAALASHVQNTSNPHGVTAAQAGAIPNTATLDDIPNGTTYAKTTAAQVAQIGTNQTNIGTIEGKIPSAASTSNQLADKAFVTDSITQGTAIFRGSFATKAALLAVAWQTTNPDAPYYVSNNDYAVVLDDETQSDECWRYIYVTGTGWTPQYRINETPLTQAQLDALNSGATSTIISSVADKLDKTGDGKDVTATFTAASTRANISTGEKLSALFGKIAKWFADLGTAAFRAATGSITSGSTALVESGAVYTGLASKAPVGYGLGVQLNTMSAIADANNISSTGWYVTDSNTLNLPSGLTGLSLAGSIYCAARGTAYKYQEYYDHPNKTVYTRFSNDNGWGSWVKVIDPQAYGLGVLLNTQENITDANAVMATGWFSTVQGVTDNLPMAKTSVAATGVLMSIARGDLYRYQKYVSYTEEKTYYRIKYNATLGWGSWIPEAKYPATEQQLATVESGTTASRNYSVGEYFCLNGLLYRAIQPIANGGTFTPGTNCEVETVGSRLTALDRFRLAVCPTGTTANPTTYTVALEPSHSYMVYIGRLTNQFVGYFVIVQAAGTVNLNTFASNGSGYYSVSTASRTLTITAMSSGVTVAWIDLGKP